MTKSIFSCQTTLKKAEFQEFGIKNATLATLLLKDNNAQILGNTAFTPQSQWKNTVLLSPV